MKKKVIAIVVSVLLVLAILVTVLVVSHIRSNRPPELDSIRGRIEQLIEASREVNEILWGEGLPTHKHIEKTDVAYKYEDENGKKHYLYYYFFPTEEHGTVLAYTYYTKTISESEGGGYIYHDVEKGGVLTGDFPSHRYATQSTEAREGYIYHNPDNGIYYYPLEGFTAEDEPRFYTSEDDPNYDYVRTDSGYLLLEDIRKKVNAVYSSAIRAEIEEAVFTGVTFQEGEDGTSYPRYRDMEAENGSYSLTKINKAWPTFRLLDYVYDYSSMRLVDPSKASSVTVAIDCHLRDDPAKKEVREFTLVLEGDQWYLDDYTR